MYIDCKWWKESLNSDDNKIHQYINMTPHPPHPLLQGSNVVCCILTHQCYWSDVWSCLKLAVSNGKFPFTGESLFSVVYFLSSSLVYIINTQNINMNVKLKVSAFVIICLLLTKCNKTVNFQLIIVFLLRIFLNELVRKGMDATDTRYYPALHLHIL